MPAGCSCAQVVLGKIYPNACPLYGKACTPRNPVGPCMVSDEGACRIWWAGGVRNDEKADAEPAKA
jgi:hydrogenase expression/formation protein HypD